VSGSIYAINLEETIGRLRARLDAMTCERDDWRTEAAAVKAELAALKLPDGWVVDSCMREFDHEWLLVCVAEPVGAEWGWYLLSDSDYPDPRHEEDSGTAYSMLEAIGAADAAAAKLLPQ